MHRFATKTISEETARIETDLQYGHHVPSPPPEKIPPSILNDRQRKSGGNQSQKVECVFTKKKCNANKLSSVITQMPIYAQKIDHKNNFGGNSADRNRSAIRAPCSIRLHPVPEKIPPSILNGRRRKSGGN
ncbi:hypothetical protein CEXT_415541 [Caerostris extrusa]|uniref:Uncharacterized protein n=1 Tax=Caerostris extrusa TaxID=172846 RepID=A0AAV4N2J4_CAEEX|nr:hypothetical protein CEXT_415541 [Caerostris extrusa]